MERGLPRMKAYDYVQRAAMKTWKEGSDFKQNLLEDADVPKYLNGKDLDKIFNLDYYLRNVNKIFRKVGI